MTLKRHLDPSFRLQVLTPVPKLPPYENISPRRSDMIEIQVLKLVSRLSLPEAASCMMAQLDDGTEAVLHEAD